ncbi:MAG: helix-turn-helix domain-containing protein [Phycisphaeraceae bacterium]
MQGRRTALIVGMNEATRFQILFWLRATKTPQGLAKRARAMLLLADGQSYAATARQVSMRERHVRKWAKRFLRQGPAGLYDAPRSGRPPVFSPRSGHPFCQDRLRVAG